MTVRSDKYSIARIKIEAKNAADRSAADKAESLISSALSVDLSDLLTNVKPQVVTPPNQPTPPEAVNAMILERTGEVTKKIAIAKANEVLKEVIKIHTGFFRNLGALIVGSSGPPDLGQYTPTWQRLSPGYAARRARERRVPTNQFYKNDGGLRTSLRNLNVMNVFGTPNVQVRDARRKDKTYDILLAPFPGQVKRGRQVGKLFNLDLDKPFDEREFFGSKYEKIAYKLSNFRGAKYREILRPYMQWWFNVRLKDAVEKAMNK